jgi:hypothetical protein
MFFKRRFDKKKGKENLESGLDLHGREKANTMKCLRNILLSPRCDMHILKREAVECKFLLKKIIVDKYRRINT